MFISKVIFHFILFIFFTFCLSFYSKREGWHYPAPWYLPGFAPAPLPTPSDTEIHKMSLTC